MPAQGMSRRGTTPPPRTAETEHLYDRGVPKPHTKAEIRRQKQSVYGNPVKPSKDTSSEFWGQRLPYFSNHELHKVDAMLDCRPKKKRKPKSQPHQPALAMDGTDVPRDVEAVVAEEVVQLPTPQQEQSPIAPTEPISESLRGTGKKRKRTAQAAAAASAGVPAAPEVAPAGRKTLAGTPEHVTGGDDVVERSEGRRSGNKRSRARKAARKARRAEGVIVAQPEVDNTREPQPAALAQLEQVDAAAAVEQVDIIEPEQVAAAEVEQVEMTEPEQVAATEVEQVEMTEPEQVAVAEEEQVVEHDGTSSNDVVTEIITETVTEIITESGTKTITEVVTESVPSATMDGVADLATVPALEAANESSIAEVVDNALPASSALAIPTEHFVYEHVEEDSIMPDIDAEPVEMSTITEQIVTEPVVHEAAAVFEHGMEPVAEASIEFLTEDGDAEDLAGEVSDGEGHGDEVYIAAGEDGTPEFYEEEGESAGVLGQEE